MDCVKGLIAMPTRLRDVEKFFERIAVLETQMKNIMSFQRWQTGLLAALILMAIKAWVSK